MNNEETAVQMQSPLQTPVSKPRMTKPKVAAVQAPV